MKNNCKPFPPCVLFASKPRQLLALYHTQRFVLQIRDWACFLYDERPVFYLNTAFVLTVGLEQFKIIDKLLGWLSSDVTACLTRKWWLHHNNAAFHTIIYCSLLHWDTFPTSTWATHTHSGPTFCCCGHLKINSVNKRCGVRMLWSGVGIWRSVSFVVQQTPVPVELYATRARLTC